MAGRWLGAAILCAIAFPAAAKTRPAEFLTFGQSVDAPRGYLEMCSSDQAICDKMRESTATPAASRPAIVVPGTVALHVTVNECGFSPFDLAASVTDITGRSMAPAPGRQISGCDSATPFEQSNDMVLDVRQRQRAIGVIPPVGTAMVDFRVPSGYVRGVAAASSAGGSEFKQFEAGFASADPRLVSKPFTSDPKLAPALPEGAPSSSAGTAKPLRDLLKRVNERVNAHVSQQSDERTYGRAELWRPSGDSARAAGDCEDIAIQKRLELIDAGFPAHRLFFAVVYRSGVGLHTVLVARLDEGDVVLDSRVRYIQKWSSAGYSWVSAQSPASPSVWHALV